MAPFHRYVQNPKAETFVTSFAEIEQEIERKKEPRAVMTQAEEEAEILKKLPKEYHDLLKCSQRENPTQCLPTERE